MIADSKAISLDRMVRAVEKVRERLLLATSALAKAGIPYAVVGGNAVAAWVSTVDEGAVRNTRDVDIMIDRGQLESVKRVLGAAGFTYRHVAGIDVLLDSPDASVRDGVHLIFAGEMVRPEEPGPNPELSEAQPGAEFRILNLEALVRIKLTAYRRKDQVHLQDMIQVGLIDESWIAKFYGELALRLQTLLEDPEG